MAIPFGFDSVLSPAQLYGMTFAVAVASGLIPLINIEAYLLAVAALSSVAPAPIILITTLGQMVAKSLLFLAGRGALRLPFRRYRENLDRASAAIDRHKGRAELVVLVSAVTGIPPFYAMSILAGTLRMSAWRFLVPGTLGRVFRFAVVFLAPRFLRDVS